MTTQHYLFWMSVADSLSPTQYRCNMMSAHFPQQTSELTSNSEGALHDTRTQYLFEHTVFYQVHWYSRIDGTRHNACACVRCAKDFSSNTKRPAGMTRQHLTCVYVSLATLHI